MSEWPEWLQEGREVIVVLTGEQPSYQGVVGGANAAGIWIERREFYGEHGGGEDSGWSFIPWVQVLRVDLDTREEPSP